MRRRAVTHRRCNAESRARAAGDIQAESEHARQAVATPAEAAAAIMAQPRPVEVADRIRAAEAADRITAEEEARLLPVVAVEHAAAEASPAAAVAAHTAAEVVVEDSPAAVVAAHAAAAAVAQLPLVAALLRVVVAEAIARPRRPGRLLQ